MKKAIVTGAGGFIGKNLVKTLLNNGVKVYGVTRDIERVKLLCEDTNFIPIEADFSSYEKLLDIIKEERIDTFYHLSWKGVDKDRNDFNVQYENVEATYKCAVLAGKLKCSKFVFACSSHEYQKKYFQDNYDKKNGYCSIYGASKKAAKAYAKVVAQEYNMAFNGAIFTNVFGVGDTSNRSTNTFIRKLLRGETIQVIKGDDLYDWTYIDDAVRGLIAIGQSGIDGKEYYVGSGMLRPFKDIINQVRDIVSPQSMLEFGAYPDTSYIDYSHIDIYELYNDTGYFPKCNFRDSILKTVDWIKSIDAEKG